MPAPMSHPQTNDEEESLGLFQSSHRQGRHSSLDFQSSSPHPNSGSWKSKIKVSIEIQTSPFVTHHTFPFYGPSFKDLDKASQLYWTRAQVNDLILVGWSLHWLCLQIRWHLKALEVRIIWGRHSLVHDRQHICGHIDKTHCHKQKAIRFKGTHLESWHQGGWGRKIA